VVLEIHRQQLGDSIAGGLEVLRREEEGKVRQQDKRRRTRRGENNRKRNRKEVRSGFLIPKLGPENREVWGVITSRSNKCLTVRTRPTRRTLAHTVDTGTMKVTLRRTGRAESGFVEGHSCCLPSRVNEFSDGNPWEMEMEKEFTKKENKKKRK
jgi:hypothetical protein